MELTLPKNYIFLGKTGSGKTQCFKSVYLNVLKEKYKKHYVFVLCTTANYSGDYDFIDPKFIKTDYKKFHQDLINIVEFSKKLHKKKADINVVVVIDDALGVLDFNDKEITNFIISARHYNLSFIIMLQQLTKYVQGGLRNNFSYLFINNVSDNSNIKCLYELTSVFDKQSECKKYISTNCVNHNTVFIDNNSVVVVEPHVFNSQDLYHISES